MRKLRKDLQFVFQDPFSSLNPRMTVGAIVEEPLTIHTQDGKPARQEKVARLLQRVGLRSSMQKLSMTRNTPLAEIARSIIAAKDLLG